MLRTLKLTMLVWLVPPAKNHQKSSTSPLQTLLEESSSYPLLHRQTSPSANSPPPQYHCLYEGCNHVSTRSFDLQRHMKKHTPIPAEDKYDCPGRGCGRVGSHGFDRKDHMIEHLRNYHMQEIPKGRNASSKVVSGSSKKKRGENY